MKLRINRYLLGIFIVALGCTFIPRIASAQSGALGNKEVYSGTTTASIVGTPAYVDAKAFQNGSNDICSIINQALVNLAASGAIGGVVDARGIQNLTTPGNPLECAKNTTPWVQLVSGVYKLTSFPADILLPRATICLRSPWVIPDNTRVYGIGMYGTNGTALRAAVGGLVVGCASGNDFSDLNTSANGGPALVYMGFPGNVKPKVTASLSYDTAPCPVAGCTDLGMKYVQVDGQALTSIPTTANAIVNWNVLGKSFEDQSITPYIGLTGLFSHATRSVYTDFSMSMNSAAQITTNCVQLTGGAYAVLRGETCIGGYYLDPNDPTHMRKLPMGTAVNASSLGADVQDVHMETVDDGVYVGLGNPSQGAVVMNISGAQDTTSIVGCQESLGCGGVLHISNKFNSGTGSFDPIDITGIAISSSCNAAPNACNSGAYTIQDEGKPKSILQNGFPNGNDNDQALALYAEGESTSSVVPLYTRLTTSPRLQTWGVGSGVPLTTTGVQACAPGAIYSNTSATHTGSPNTIYVCQFTNTTYTPTHWVAVK